MQASGSVDRSLWNYHRRMLIVGPTRAYGLAVGCALSAASGAIIALAVNTNGDVRLIAELICPILSALLVAFGMEPEIRSGSLGLLSLRTAFVRRVILPRTLGGMAVALLLVGFTLALLSTLIPSTEILPALLAAAPSAWALSLLALTFGMLFRSSLSGFLVAAMIWGLNVVYGYGLHPLLGLSGFSARNDLHPLGNLWLVGKLSLLLAGALLIACQRRWLVGRRALLRPEPLSIAAVMLVVGGAYVVSGAISVVSYAYLARGSQQNSTSEWTRTQMEPFRGFGLPALFGPAFRAYIAVPPQGLSAESARETRTRQLETALSRWPHSIWAESIALERVTVARPSNPAEASRAYLQFAETHPRSPLVRQALYRVIQIQEMSYPSLAYHEDHARPGSAEAFAAAQKLVERYPRSLEARRAMAYLENHY